MNFTKIRPEPTSSHELLGVSIPVCLNFHWYFSRILSCTFSGELLQAKYDHSVLVALCCNCLFHLRPADACNKPLGISDYRIRDEQMSASSAYDNDYATFGAHRARLNLTSWPAGYRANTEKADYFPYLKINLDQEMVITGIATQGFGNASLNVWLESYMVLYDKRGAEETVSCTTEDGETLKVSTFVILVVGPDKRLWRQESKSHI